ncbi:Iron-chelate-transporting ATPase [Alteripontixanthobacter maritimus]|uniref:Iron-chelate-transporting ATPase n=1 Tax=Alteripontixanthobacter maritimus TaxID=2161824 RepID=A0A369Q2M1_9SPHN|nr:ATP-binding cassette domain-containing protein [Alteripontixanthobacter maritimus]RDC59014.1 Iron-chelate-transporting ATPase [Alteripontixanthobacter maritimus]
MNADTRRTESRTAALAFEDIRKDYGTLAAVDNVSLLVPHGQFAALVGASGSGKSTLLKMVNRLIEPSGGRVLLNGANVLDGPAAAIRRRIGYAFQSIGLFPHMDVARNIGIGPKLAGAAPDDARIAELLELVELEPHHARRMPHELSGGQRQRVGLARALAAGPELLLLDEPFGALDPVTRDALGKRVRALHERLGLTTVLVTHDMAEALLLADRVLVMDSGRVVADENPAALLAGAGGDIAQALVAVPRAQADALEAMMHAPQGGAA